MSLLSRIRDAFVGAPRMDVRDRVPMELEAIWITYYSSLISPKLENRWTDAWLTLAETVRVDPRQMRPSDRIVGDLCRGCAVATPTEDDVTEWFIEKLGYRPSDQEMVMIETVDDAIRTIIKS